MPLKFIISGGGTGGHIFPAVAVAREIRQRHPDCEILFIGAVGRMEMEKIPAEGFEITGLKVSGLKRSFTLSNLKVAYQFISSYYKAKKLIRDFKPDCVLGTGGYVSFAVLRAAAGLKIPTVIWEGNGFAGLTNRMLAKRVTAICTGLPSMEAFFPASKTIYTGNPVRPEILKLPPKAEAVHFFKLNPSLKTLFITGGSLGARTINESIWNGLDQLKDAGVQLIWQTGKSFSRNRDDIQMFQFLKEMNMAYAAADLVVSRAGALSIAEITVAGKASVLVPSPNVTDDHQTKNALKLSEKNAAVLVHDKEASAMLVNKCLELLVDGKKLKELATNAKQMAMPDATSKMAECNTRFMPEERLKHIKQAYFMGIGGIGMSAIARYFSSMGIAVSGYDKTPSDLTQTLTAEGMDVNYSDTVEAIPASVRENPDDTLFIITPAIPSDSVQWNYIQNQGWPVYKRSEILGLISRNGTCIAVAGTHGKTTTSTLIAHILHHCNINFTAFLGGISSNYNTNYLQKKDGLQITENLIVLEADEFDRSFHRLSPDIAVITAIDPDHLDIYETRESFLQAFEGFVMQVKPEGSLLLNHRISIDIPASIHTYRYGLNAPENTEFNSISEGIEHGYFRFRYQSRFEEDDAVSERELINIASGLPGYHNIENATAAIAVCMDLLHLEAYAVKEAIKTFTGVKRRFEFVVRNDQYTVIDDYAHHPEEIRAIITSVKDMFPGKKLTVVFQPHLFSRTRDFASGFAETLSLADELMLMEIYPAREQPIPGINSTWLKDMIQGINASVESAAGVLERVTAEKPELLLMLGAGDIDRLIPKIREVYGHF